MSSGSCVKGGLSFQGFRVCGIEKKQKAFSIGETLYLAFSKKPLSLTNRGTDS